MVKYLDWILDFWAEDTVDGGSDERLALDNPVVNPHPENKMRGNEMLVGLCLFPDYDYL